MRIFPVFYYFLLRFTKFQLALSGQNLINDAKSRYIKGRILIKKDNVGTMAPQLCNGRRRATQLPCDLGMSHDYRWQQPKHHHR
jgi:hypothetical protein